MKPHTARVVSITEHQRQDSENNFDYREASSSLDDKEAFFAHLVENSADLIVISDADGIIRYISPSVEHAQGFKAEEMIGKSLSEFTHPDDRALGAISGADLITNTGKTIGPFVKRLRHKDSSYQWYESLSKPFSKGSGEMRVISNIRNITERKEIEEKLAVSEAQFRSMAEHSRDMIWTGDMATGRFTYISPAVLQLRGYTVEEAMEQQIIDQVAPSSRIEAMLISEWIEAAQMDRDVKPYTDTLEYTCKDGGTVWVETNITPLYDTAGNLVGIQGVSRDISERRQAEKELSKKEAQYRLLADNSRDMIWTADIATARFTYISPAVLQLRGYTVEEAMEQHIIDQVAPSWRTEAMLISEWIEAAQTTRDVKPYVDKLEYTCKDGGTVWVETNITPIYDTAGSLVGVQGVSRNISERRRMEEALKKSESLYRLIADNSKDMTWAMDLVTGRYTYVSPSVFTLRGYTVEEAMTQSVQELVAPSSITIVKEHMKKVIEAMNRGEIVETCSFDLEYLRKNSSTIWLETTVNPMYDAANTLVGVQGVSRDISERRRMEEALRNSEKRFRTYTENASDLVMVVGTSHLLTYVSPSIERILGYRPEELMGTQILALLHPDDIPAAIAAHQETALHPGVPGNTIEQRYRHKDGSWRHFGAVGAYIILNPGEVYDVLNLRDITERKLMEEALRQNEKQYRMLAENSHDFIWTIDPKRNAHTYVSPAIEHLTGYTPEEALALTPEQTMTTDSWLLVNEYVKSTVEAARKGERPPVESIEVEHLRKDGSTVWVESTVVPIFDDSGHLVALQGVDRDITERRRGQQELAKRAEELSRSNRELEQFAYIASHDLQEPLRMVASYTGLLGRRYKGKLDEDADEFIAFACDGATRMKRLINDLLVYSRVGTKGKPFILTDCNSVFRQTIMNLEMAIEDNHAVVTSDPLPTVMGDDVQLTQLFQNLTANAIKFHGPVAPTVHISAIERDDKWLFSIKDNGIGIDSEYFERIFVIFQRLHSKEEYSGTGIGLAVCKKIVERHHGTIWVESEPGKGTTFFFTIPLKEITNE